MGFSDELRAMAAPMWETEHNHPFVTGIGDGSLPLEKFKYYLEQDYIFLIDYCRAISLAVAKASSVEDMGWFAKLIHETLNIEMSLHVGFCADFGITEEELKSTKPSPTTVAYSNHMIQTAFSGNVGEIASVILPCAWGYCEIGKKLAPQRVSESQPLYARWIEMYNSPEFEELALWIRSFVDRIANDSSESEMARMERAFMLSSQFEYMFWDAAYRLEKWPV
ncbi:thiaminase II [Dehalococcoidia bacterium]|nr:thiaminase II [Dehalococcoidia bacterium]